MAGTMFLKADLITLVGDNYERQIAGLQEELATELNTTDTERLTGWRAEQAIAVLDLAMAATWAAMLR